MQSRLQPAVSSRLSGVVTTVASTTEDYITARLDAETKTWQTVNPALAQPIADLKDMVMRGGKRLRPALCTAAYWGIAQPDATSDQIQQWLRDSETRRDARAQLLGANAALELIQTFALIHDDIMDGALTRRGAPTIHHRWGLLHGDLKWRGESRRVSEGVAILVGDLAFVYADIMLRGASASVIDVFNALRLEVNYGQYLDVYATAALMPTMSDAQQIAQYKSGKYSVERPLHLGAAVAGHLAEFGDALSAVGMPLGEAFQYRDDLLGVYGDPTKTGKPVGHDLVEAKPTVLIASAFAGATPSQKTQLNQLFGAPELSDADVDTLKQLLDDTGARAKTESLIERQTNNSLEAIQELRTRGFGANAAEFLELLVHLITDRNA